MGGISRKLRIMLLTAAALALSCGSALADWTITDLTAALTPEGSSITRVWGSSINNSGDVVGSARFPDTGNYHAALWQNGVVYDLGILGNPQSSSQSSAAHYITDSGLIVGESYSATTSTTNNYRQAVIFSVGSTPQNIHSPMTYVANNSVASAAGNGYILGQAYNDNVSTSHAVLWSNNGTTAVDMNPTGYTSTASALRSINSSGQMVGYSVPYDIGYSRPTLWDTDGSVTYLDLVNDPRYSALNWSAHSGYARDINDAGQVAVWFTNGISGIWQNDGSFTQINNLPGAYDKLVLSGINNSGLAVGSASYTDWANGGSGVSRAVLYDNGNLIDLGALFEGTGLYLTDAVDINDKGQILVYANKTGFNGSTLNDNITLVLTPGAVPTPIPAALPLFASGLAALGVFRRRFFHA